MESGIRVCTPVILASGVERGRSRALGQPGLYSKTCSPKKMKEKEEKEKEEKKEEREGRKEREREGEKEGVGDEKFIPALQAHSLKLKDGLIIKLKADLPLG